MAAVLVTVMIPYISPTSPPYLPVSPPISGGGGRAGGRDARVRGGVLGARAHLAGSG